MELSQVQAFYQDDAIPRVSPAIAHFHISLLRKFNQLYHSFEYSPPQDDYGKFTLPEAFLALAESRYLLYLNLLSDVAAKSSKSERFANIIPLPPWDVAIVFHDHCLNPISFTADLNGSFKGLLEAGIEFPLERLHSLIKLGINCHTESEQQWNDYQTRLNHRRDPIPYQLCSTLPQSVGDCDFLKATRIPWCCPGCKQETAFDITRFATMRLAANLVTCSNCEMAFQAAPFATDLVSASLRQRSFAAKMASDWCFRLDTPSSLEEAISRYRKFMFLDVDMEGSGIVPTLDIDLIWHTHQLSPVEYRHWCLSNLHRYINHDDTVSEDNIAIGLDNTVDMWFAKFGEKYEIDLFPKPSETDKTERPLANYCKYNDLCWSAVFFSNIGCTFLDEVPHEVPSNPAAQLLSCRYRCAKCSKADCHKPSNDGVQLLSCRYRCSKCFKADCHKPSK